MAGQLEASAPPKDIMMAVSSEHALREAELLNLRQIATALENTNRALVATNERLDKIDSSVDQVREKVIRIEAQNEARSDLRVEVEELKVEVAGLNKDLQQRVGAGRLLTVVKDFTPWIVGIAAAALAAAGRIHIG